MMKRIIYSLLVVTVMALGLTGCEELPTPDNKVPKINMESEPVGAVVDATLKAYSSYEARSSYFLIGQNANLSDAEKKIAYIKRNNNWYWVYSFSVAGLMPGTTYYYQFVLDDGKQSIKSQILSFTTDTGYTQNLKWGYTYSNVSVEQSVEIYAYTPSYLPITYKITTGEDCAVLSGNILKPKKPGTVVIVASQGGNELWKPASDIEMTIQILPVEMTYVDLGLSVKWANMNLGSYMPADPGKYYAWGELSNKDSYTEKNYTVKTELDIITGNDKYDAATASLGSQWRIPTKEEIEELINKCTWTWTTRNDMQGYKVTGPNKKEIFIPAGGYYDNTSIIDAQKYLRLWSSSKYLFFDGKYITDTSLYYGLNIRPVYGKQTLLEGGDVIVNDWNKENDGSITVK